MYGIGAISSISFCGKFGDAAKNTVKKVVEHVKENKDDYMATGAAV